MPRAATPLNASSYQLRPAAWRPKQSETATTVKRPVCSGHPVLLWIDDYKLGLQLYRAMFENLGFKVLTASSGAEGVKLAAANPVDVVVTDFEMPGMNGEAVAAAIRAIDPRVPVVLFSGSTLVSARTRRMFDACCDKAGSRDQLSTSILRVLRKKHGRSLQPPPMTRASDEGRRTVA